MAEKRRGLGRGIGALIPTGPPAGTRAARPADIFFDGPGTAQAETKQQVTGPADALETMPGAAPDESVSAESPVTAAPDKATAGSMRTSTTVDAAATPAELEQSRSGRTAIPDDAGTSTGAIGTPSSDGDRTYPDAGATAVRRSEDASVAVDDDGLRPVPGATYAEVPVSSIVPNARQPRQVFDEDDLDELAASIRELGVLQPVVVRPIATQDPRRSDDVRYELVMGERRLRASMQAGLTDIPAVIRSTDDTDLLRDALLENLHRAQLNPLEEAAAYQQLLDDFGGTHDELARRIARSRPQISNTLRLLKLPALVQRRVAAGVLSAGHARALLGLEDGAAMERLAQRIVAEGLSVRATEEAVAMGEGPTRPELRRRRAPAAHSEQLDRLAGRLSDRLDTRVKVSMGQRKGRITVDFASVEDLDRILATLAPGEQVDSD
ncbi:ParB/RepB/Spo0J family partition protein [Georgenia sp. Z1344]|uniref:ParB/RepB/Spo0J family partition protein n=1 Tax=Georgenia sp. Z1344 TaxID=3416706 RepID=UPI003CF7CB8C